MNETTIWIMASKQILTVSITKRNAILMTCTHIMKRPQTEILCTCSERTLKRTGG